MYIRTAKADDLDQIVEIEQECFPASEAASRQSFKNRLAYYPDHFWVLCDGADITGFVNGMVSSQRDLKDEMYENAGMHQKDGSWQMIFGVDVRPQYRRRGYAERLLRYVIGEAKTQGRDGLVLTCKERLIHYYAKFGFQDEGMSESVHGGVCWHQMRMCLKMSGVRITSRQTI